ncbi:MAG: penicillin-binding protein 1C [Bacteroidia bacterium]
MPLYLKAFFRKHRYATAAILALGMVLFCFSLPDPLFKQPYSFVITATDGQLLQARIAADGQWRFPQTDTVPAKFEKALLAYEDRHFYAHPGVDPLAFGRAVWQNIRAKKVVSGGSTISMQVIRLSRGNKSRNLWQKLVEMLLAVRLELGYSKKSILNLYASHAPFGGNVVGLNAASWRYFGRPANELSWAEAATLAVLPNSPALVHPGRNRNQLRQKRDHLLHILYSRKMLDAETYRLAKLENIPDEPLPLPQFAPHLLGTLQQQYANRKQKPALVETTIQLPLQKSVTQILNRHHEYLSANGINNAAALVLDVETGNVMSYVGNVYRPDKPEFDSHVDVIQAPRSPGSTLKPLLYESMLHDGSLLPNTLIADIPTQIAGYTPQNFDLTYDGAVPADKALSRSLNIPAVRMLQQFGVEKFHLGLRKMGVTTLTNRADHYGLSLILGGGENKLWELAGIYGSMARILNHFNTQNGRYNPDDLHPPFVEKNAERPAKKTYKQLSKNALMSAAAIYYTFEAMSEVMRPGEEMLWQQFNSAQRIAWKTGTSFGFRDGWAIGLTPQYVVAVWVGNADGEGRPNLTGISTAAPILFDIFKQLPVAQNWFSMPYGEMVKVPVCRQSGHRALDICEVKDSVWIPRTGLRTAACPYHQLVHIDLSGKYRVNSDCVPVSQIQNRSWFVLPPAMEWYYKNHTPSYKVLPPFREDCLQSFAGNAMEMIYPKKSNKIFVPVELDGKTGKCVFEVAHRNPKTKIHWHLDDTYIGTAQDFHQMALAPAAGKHLLVLIDEFGERLEQNFEVVGK